jgi:hypothetical protein
MAQLRTGLARSGIKPTELHDCEFYVGRNPVESADAKRPASVRRVS